jgi:hypothetical protein
MKTPHVPAARSEHEPTTYKELSDRETDREATSVPHVARTDRQRTPARAMTDLARKESEFLLYMAPNGAVKVGVLFRDETAWLTQRALAELFGVNVPALGFQFHRARSGLLDRVEQSRAVIDVAIPAGHCGSTIEHSRSAVHPFADHPPRGSGRSETSTHVRP